MSLKGVWTMLATPMTSDCAVAVDKVGPYIENQIAQGIAGVMALGSTGEFYALDPSERRRVLNEVARFVDGRIGIAAGANAGSTRDVIDNAKMARDAGYPTILLAPPYYSNPDQDHLRRHFETVAAAVEIDIILYDNPAQAGVAIGLDLLDALSPNPRFVAIREASGNLLRAFAVKERFEDRYPIISGADDIALDLMFWGTRCWMSGPSNFLAAEFVAIHKAATAEDWNTAKRLMRRVLPLVAEIESGKYLARIKHCANRCGLDVGPSRGPVFDLTREEAARLDNLLDAAKQA